MPSSIWRGTVGFGLVAVPVRLVSALTPRGSGFRLLHRQDNSPLRRRLYCEVERRLVEPEEVGRAFEVEPGKLVVVTDEELRSLAPGRSRTMEIQDFVPLDQLDPSLFARPYYLLPDGAPKPYLLLAEILGESSRAGISRFVLTEREYLGVLMAVEGGLCLELLHYQEELRPPVRIEASPDPAMVEAMASAVRSMEGSFHPEEHRDRQRDMVREYVEEKRQREGTVVPPHQEEESEEAGSADDLMAALEASIAAAR